MVTVTSDTEFIIGIDFGHGETSAAFYGITTPEKKDLDILPGLNVIKSAVAILEQEGRESICVGESAIQNAPYAKDFQIAFKKRPSEMSEIERNRMVAFMKGVYSGILDRHPDYKSRKHVVYIARPSQDEKWKSEESAYIKIAEDAGLPVAGIQKESRAAYFRARTQPDSKIDSQVKEGVLIVDYGSSTIDFTYLNNKLQKPIDHGCDLGASEVERLLLDYAMEHPCDPYMHEFSKTYGKDKGSNPYNQMLYSFRKAKESFYGNKLQKFSLQFDYNDLTSSEESPICGFGGFKISKEDVNKILGLNNSEGYIEKVRSEVVKFKEEKLKDNKVVCVYLTGGASRMDFVRQIFMDVFNLNENQCPADDNPSVIVSQGVAHLSYADYVTAKKEEELRKIAQTAISQYDWSGNIREIVNKSIKAKIIDKAWDIMLAYERGDVYEYLSLTKDKYGDHYIGMEYEENGYQKVRNVRALKSKFTSTFEYLVHYDFAAECEKSITSYIVDSVIKKLKSALQAFEYNPSSSKSLKITGLSASITKSGAEQLSTRFTGDGKGHIIRDAVASCWMVMCDLDVYKDRWDSDRKQHYDYYRKYDSEIFSSYSWDVFLKNKINISGIDSAKQQTKSYVDLLIDDYVSYAKLAIFFK
ncbi:MAG: hypothetical protein KBT06_08670 [Prevotellaceae bacterium]|nr:hypothetical protein [Candidatus Colivivens equi]